MQRFFLPPESFQGQQIVFPDDLAHQISHVLRMQSGQKVIVLDNAGSAYTVQLDQVAQKSVNGWVEKKELVNGEPSTAVKLYLCLTQREKFEWILQKCTEIGVAEFVPVISSRSLVQNQKDETKKMERWERIIREAAEQSGRGTLPRLSAARQFEQAVYAEEDAKALKLIPSVKERSQNLKQVMQSFKPESSVNQISVIIGPEGGFSENEVENAERAGYLPITLGPRVLRMETAAMTVTALILYELGEMN